MGRERVPSERGEQGRGVCGSLPTPPSLAFGPDTTGVPTGLEEVRLSLEGPESSPSPGRSRPDLSEEPGGVGWDGTRSRRSG